MNFLTNYHQINTSYLPDLGEKIGGWGTAWLSCAFGKRYIVTKLKDSSNLLFQEHNYPTYKKVIAAVFAIILFPLSLSFAGIGCIGYALSKTRVKLVNSHLKALDCVIPRKEQPKEPEKPKLKVNLSEEIPKNCDIRGRKWLTNGHLYAYAADFNKRNKSNVNFQPFNFKIALWHFSLNPIKSDYAFFISEFNHHTFVYVCTKTRTIEFYDSKVNYAVDQMKSLLEELRKTIDQHNPGATSYRVVHKIKKELQPDSYQCGCWVLYFFENRINNAAVDFNELDIEDSQTMIADFRLKIMNRLIEIK